MTADTAMQDSPPHTTDAELLAALAAGGRALMAAEYWADGVDRLLAEIGRVTGVSRVWVFQLIELQNNTLIQDYVFEWAAAPRYRQLHHRQFRFFSASLDEPAYRQLVEQRQRGLAQDMLVDRLPPGGLRDNLQGQGILSMTTVPIWVQGRWWGTLGIDDCERAVLRKGPQLDTLTVAAELIAAAIYRHQLTSRSRQLELFHQVADCGVWEVDLETGTLWCSQSMRVKLGYPATYPRIPLRRFLAHIQPEDRRRLWTSLRERLATGSVPWRLDVRFGNNADMSWHEIVSEIRYDADNRPSSIAGLIIDIHRRKQYETRAVEAAERDELTGVLNRRGLERQRSHLLANTPDSPLHLLLLDIDHFKSLNDRHGHQAGDNVLKVFVNRLSNELRPHDLLARVGGEEFAILVGRLNDTEAWHLAERLRRRIADAPFIIDIPGRLGIVHLDISTSIGIARMPEGADAVERWEQLMARADQALYAAKHGGRNRSVAYRQHAG